MKYGEIKKHCESLSAISRTVVDEFLIYYAADREKLVLQIEGFLKKYRRAASEIPVSYINFLKSEYIAHKVFGENDLIKSYLTHPAIRQLPEEQFRYLEAQAASRWHFSFAQIVARPGDSFFQMEDVMTGEEYLLYSPGMQATENEMHPRLWFNLIAFNGKCWQTFGLIIPFRSFSADDIFFFATEINSRINDEESLMAEVEKNPFPFFMLMCASNLPVVISRDFETIICLAEDETADFSTELLRTDFDVAWNKNVYRLSLKKAAEFPHYAMAYYDEKSKALVRTAMTPHGFSLLTEKLAGMGLVLNHDPDVMVSPSMLSTVEKVLNKKIRLHPYEKLFSTQDANRSKELEKLNHFLKLALPMYNTGKEINVNELADKAGIDPVTAEAIWKKVKGKTDKLKDKYK